MFACLHAPGLPDSSHALLVNCACGFSPRVEETDAGTVVLDIDGLDRLLGPVESIADAILRRAAALGMQMNVATAANPDAAVHAARGFPGITILPKGEEASILASLPVMLLDPSPEMAETLASWGIRSFRDLAALPEAGLAARLGAEGVRLQKLARGAGDRPLVPAVPADGFAASLELEHPVMLFEPLSFLLARLLGEVLEKLGAQGLATDELRLRMKLDRTGQAEAEQVHTEQVQAEHAGVPSRVPLANARGSEALILSRGALWAREGAVVKSKAGHHTRAGPAQLEKEHARTLRLPFPMRSVKTFLKLLALDLESHPPPAPVIAISLAAVAVDPRVVQYGLFLPPAPEPEKLELTLGRITKLVGRENVGAAELVDTHRPGAFRLKPFVVPEQPRIRRPKISGARGPMKPAGPISAPRAGAPSGPGKERFPRLLQQTSKIENCPLPTVHCPPPAACRFLALRVFRPPLRAEVQMEAPSGRPARIAARGVRGTVISLAGPWRSSGEWWTAGPWSRDEWDVALSNGTLYRIYRDRKDGVWFVEGLYD